MVRNWSYLTDVNLTICESRTERFAHLYNFKVFRKTTRFKRYNKGITVMVRRKYARRKHRMNWLVLSHITCAWATNYARARQFERFYSSLGCTNTSAFSSSVNVFLLCLPRLQNKGGVSISSCASKTLLRHSRLYGFANPVLRNFTQNTNGEIVHTLTAQTLSDSTDVFPNVILHDDSLYSCNDVAEREKIYLQLSAFTSDITLASTMQWVSSLNRVIVLLTLSHLYRP
jgi:hypothetical protein